MPYKIKKKYHKCENHLAPVTRLFLGFENQPLAILEKDRQIARFGMLVQCTMCKTIGVVPVVDDLPKNTLSLEPLENETKEVCGCGGNCLCKEVKDAEREETKEE